MSYQWPDPNATTVQPSYANLRGTWPNMTTGGTYATVPTLSPESASLPTGDVYQAPTPSLSSSMPTDGAGTYLPPVDVFPSPPPPTLGPTPMMSGGVTDASGNVYTDRSSTPRAYTAGAFNPNGGEWAQYGSPTAGTPFAQTINGVNYLNGVPWDPEINDTGGPAFENFVAHYQPIWEAQQNGTWTGTSIGSGDPGFGGVPTGTTGTTGGPGLNRDPNTIPNTPSAGPMTGTPSISGAPGTPGATPPGGGNLGANTPSGWKPPGTEGLPPLDTDFMGYAKNAADAAYKGATQFMDEDFGREDQALESRLLNQGFVRGTEAFDKESELQSRGHNAARQSAAYQAQQVGHQQAGDMLQRALASRAALMGERERAAAMGLTARGQDLSKYGIDSNTALALRSLGLSEDSQQFQQLVQLLAAARGGVNMPNFGPASPLDVGGAYGIAGNNLNSQLNRDAQDRSGLYGLGAAALGGVDWSSFFKKAA